VRHEQGVQLGGGARPGVPPGRGAGGPGRGPAITRRHRRLGLRRAPGGHPAARAGGGPRAGAEPGGGGQGRAGASMPVSEPRGHTRTHAVGLLPLLSLVLYYFVR
jgi:hypothetical protein